MRRKIFFISFAVLLLLAGLAVTYLWLYKRPLQWNRYNSLRPAGAPRIEDSGSVEDLVRALDFSLEYLRRLPPTRVVSFGPHTVTVQERIDSLTTFKAKLLELGLGPAFFSYVEENFAFYRSAAPKVLYTGYYEARLRGSLTRTDTYRYPLYKKPDDIYRIDLSRFPYFERYKEKLKDVPTDLRGRIGPGNTILPYYSRDEIDYQNKLADRDLEILWVDDPIEVFFLQIQGSGVVELEDGRRLRVNYADKNGHPYRAIGRLLLERGVVPREELSMQGIRKYLQEHPEEMEEIFNYNPSYVFFRLVERGPQGFIGVPLTPYRSIALDHRLFPRGGLCYIETELPLFDAAGNRSGWQKYRGFAMHQDTGGAIRTPARVDFFTGLGDDGEAVAGHLKREGDFYFLIQKRAPAPHGPVN